jgi:hypothetical protein
MSRDYRGRTGIIGQWKGRDVFVLTKEQYMDLTDKSDDTVYVIRDDNCRMIHRGDVVGVLEMGTGSVVEMTRSKYTPVRRLTTTTSASGTKSENENEYDKYASVVNEFFKHLQDPIIVSD